MPEPWASLLQGLIGPAGVVVAESVVIFFLWRLFREEQRESRSLTGAVRDLTTEVRSWRIRSSR